MNKYNYRKQDEIECCYNCIHFMIDYEIEWCNLNVCSCGESYIGICDKYERDVE